MDFFSTAFQHWHPGGKHLRLGGLRVDSDLQMLGVLNLAMGEMTFIGAYVCLEFLQLGIPFILALLFTLVVGFALGLLTEHLFLRPDGRGARLERHHGDRRSLFLLQGGGGIDLGNRYGRFHLPRYFPLSRSPSEHCSRPGLPVGFCRLDPPPHRFRLFFQVYKVGAFHAGHCG